MDSDGVRCFDCGDGGDLVDFEFVVYIRYCSAWCLLISRKFAYDHDLCEVRRFFESQEWECWEYFSKSGVSKMADMAGGPTTFPSSPYPRHYSQFPWRLQQQRTCDSMGLGFPWSPAPEALVGHTAEWGVPLGLGPELGSCGSHSMVRSQGRAPICCCIPLEALTPCFHDPATAVMSP